MLEIKVTTLNKAKSLIHEERVRNRKRKKKSPIIEEYEEYLKKLERRKAIEFILKEGDKYQTIKYRLNNAAKSLGIKNLKIERAGNKVVVYREVRPRTRRLEQYKEQPEEDAWPVQEENGEEEYLHKYEPEPEPESEPTSQEAPAIQSTFEPTPEQDLTHMPIPTLMSEQEELLAFDFDEEWEEPMIHGQKTCEASADQYTGGTFEAFGHEFFVTKVERISLGEISQRWFKQHGHFSPREFQEIWKQRYKGGFDPEQMVWLHHFKRGFEPSIEPELDSSLESEKFSID
jgi:hypothetical protein